MSEESDPPHPESAAAETNAVAKMARKEKVVTMFPEISKRMNPHLIIKNEDYACG
jgi:hypothetical protein